MNGLILCTSDCNLRCKYCFEETMHDKCMMPIDKIRSDFSNFLDCYLDQFIIQLIEINKQLKKNDTHITFHGGEPLLIGHELLEKGFQIVNKYPNTIISIQTNGTLVDDCFISIFKKYNVQIGVSLDGPKYMHDKYRKSIGGCGTFDKVFTNIKKMMDNGVVVGALATVTDETLKSPEDFYNFFADYNLPFSFNPCFTDPNLPSSYNVLNMNDYIIFYKKMFDLWIQDNTNNLPIACFERIMSSMAVKKQIWMEVCSFIPDCSRTTVAVDTSGDFYRCLHYCMDKKNRIGHLGNAALNMSLNECEISKRWDYLKTHDCQDCEIQDYCCGGCPYTAEVENGTVFSKANTCASQKAIVHHIYDYLQKYTH